MPTPRTLSDRLRVFDTIEANLQKLERVWAKLQQLTPTGTIFGDGEEYEEARFHFRTIAEALPAIGTFRIDPQVLTYNEIAQMTFDAHEAGEFYSHIAVSEAIGEPGKQIREYRRLLGTKRIALIQKRKNEICTTIDILLELLTTETTDLTEEQPIISTNFDALKERFDELDLLLGKGTRPVRWQMLRRHLGFRQVKDLNDINRFDWPAIKQSLDSMIYRDTDALPVDVSNLDELLGGSASGSIPTRLDWTTLDDEDFERLIFALIASTPGYQNAQWLQKTRAADQGRDLSVERVETDLSGPRTKRIILQCRHRLATSVTLNDVSLLEHQMKLWEPPLIDCLIIVTSGRFVKDAVTYIERQNQSNQRMRIDMWPESHIESLLAARPDLVAEFGIPRVSKKD